MYSQIKSRLYKLLALFIAVLLMLNMRTAYITLVQGDELAVITEKQYKYNENISNIKYFVQDSKGRELLGYITKYYFVIDVNTYLKNNMDTDLSKIKAITYILRGYKTDYDLDKIQNVKTNQKLYYTIDEDSYNKLSLIKGVKGVYTYKAKEVDRSNSWLYANMLTNPMTSDNKLKAEGSIERLVYEKTKNNEFPKISFEKELTGEVKEGKEELAANNINLKLTTDKSIEDLIKEVISKDKYKAYDQIGVVLSEPSTGKIKAMVQRDDWKPNIILGAATENGYEPGSIFKTITQEAAMDYMNIPVDQVYDCNEGKKNYGYINMEEAYTVSCNEYFQKLGSKIKFINILPFAKNQGVFDKVLNFDGNGEVKGDFSEDKYADVNLAIGQSMRITPIQALGIVNTVINEGSYVKPYLIDSFINNEGKVVEKCSTVKRKVFKSNTARVLKNQMIKVVEDSKGTGKYARINGVQIGGKTGTTERVVTVKNKNAVTGLEETVSEKHSDGWFIGFAKINNTYYTATVFVKDIKVQGEDAGVTAAPIFKEIIEKLIGEK
jgi:cell division protein FtsI/penicillin-binding protein 2